jgi:hypothetical protein
VLVQTSAPPLEVDQAAAGLIEALEAVADLRTLRQGLGVAIVQLADSGRPEYVPFMPAYAALERLAEAVQLRRDGEA